MTRRSLLLPAAAGSVFATMFALVQVFEHQTWLLPSIVSIGVAFGIGWAGRRLDVPAVLAPALSLLGMVTTLGLLFHADTTLAGLPTAATLRAIGESLAQAVTDVKVLAAPVLPTDALTLLATAGVFHIALVVDLIVFRARRPVAAGLPLLLLFLIPTAMAEDAAVWPFVLAAAGYLGLLVAEGRDRARSWGRRLTGIDVLDDTADVSHVARVGRRIGTAAIGVALCVPLALPSVGEGLFTGTGGLGGRGGGGNRTARAINPIVDIKGQVHAKEIVEMLRVRTDQPGGAYLRLTSLDRFNGALWDLSEQKADSDNRVGGDRRVPLPREVTAGIPLREARFDIESPGLDSSWLPVPYIPSVVDVDDDGDWRYEDIGLAVFSARRKTEGLSFSVTALQPNPSPDQLRVEAPIPPDIVARYLAVPERTPPLAEQILREVTEGKTTAYDRAYALNEYFFASGGFTYDLEVQPGHSSEALSTFLRNKRGYCEQFAAAMAYLSRLAGIPARLVVGFTPGTQNPDGTWVITNKDAHAWPELYFPSAGWVKFEPTPRNGLERPSYLPAPAQVPDGNDPVPGEDPTASPTPEPSASPTAPPGGRREADENGDVASPPEEALGGPRGGGRSGIPLAPLLVVLALAVLATPTAVAAATRRRRARGAGDHLARTHVAWAGLSDAAEDAGYPLRAADSPRAAARRLVADASLTGEIADEVHRIARAEERARYARSAEPVDGLDAGVRAVRRTLLAALPPARRARAMLFPASSLRRTFAWFRATSERVERVRTAFWRRAGEVVLRRRAATGRA
jgi:transglutaminase-like putative cysteine protease